MSIQGRFRTFDENIKLRRFSENAELVQKRERVLNRLREGLESRFPYRNERPTFDYFNQGSYEMGTGVKPIKGDYDIDVGLVFDIRTGDHDPVEVKTWVYDAVRMHTTDVQFRRPCITVFYVEGGEPKYHVDLAVYAKADGRGGPYLAMGKANSSTAQREWVPSSPQELTRLIANRFQGSNGEQFCRIVRYLKRWKDLNFSAEGHAAPRGIALTACAYEGFRPAVEDLDALRNLVSNILANFRGWDSRIQVALPTAPGNDLFEKMSTQKMLEFKQRLEILRGRLNEAASAYSEYEASIFLRTQFGGAFPE